VDSSGGRSKRCCWPLHSTSGRTMANANSHVTIHMAASLDGFIARKDGRVDWLETRDEFAGGDPMDPEFVEAFLKTIDCYVMGSRTYETALRFEAQGLGWPYGDKPSFVLSSKPTGAAWWSFVTRCEGQGALGSDPTSASICSTTSRGANASPRQLLLRSLLPRSGTTAPTTRNARSGRCRGSTPMSALGSRD
jgi:hypothetical protein